MGYWGIFTTVVFHWPKLYVAMTTTENVKEMTVYKNNSDNSDV